MACTKAEAEKQAQEIVENWVAAAALTGWAPGSAIFLTGADVSMGRQVADASGVDVFDENALAGAMGTPVTGAVAGGIIAEGVGLIPVLGWLVKSGLMAAKAQVIGQATIDFFKEHKGTQPPI